MPERASNPEAHVKAYPPNPHRGRLNGSVRVRAMSALSPMRTRQAGNFFLSPASPEVGETQLVKAAIDGLLPHGMGVVRLSDLPAEWSRQNLMLGLKGR